MVDDTRYLAYPAQAHVLEIFLFVMIVGLTVAAVVYAFINRKLSQAVPIVLMAAYGLPDFFIKSFKIRVCIMSVVLVIALVGTWWFDRKTPKKPN